MTRIIQSDSAGKQRTFLTRSILVAIQELMRQQQVDARTRDLASFIAIALDEIDGTIEASVSAWEKRGYWLKADRFRMEWEWAGLLSQKMKKAIFADRWDEAAAVAAQIAARLSTVKLPKRGFKVEFWDGAWEKLKLIHSPK